MLREDCRQISIIAMSANAFDEDVKRSLASGMNGHLSKPVTVEKLIEMLELNPNYQIHNYEKELAISAEPLQFCMGDLFTGVKLECIA